MTTLLRTEMIKLNAFFIRVGVPGVSSSCLYKAQNEIFKYIVIFCPDRATRKAEILIKTGISHYDELLTTEKGLTAVSGWFFKHGGLTQLA